MGKQFFLLALLFSLAQAFSNIESGEVAMLAADKDVLLVDVRLKQEWEQSGIIPNSLMITYFDEKAKALKQEFLTKLEKASEGNKEKSIVLICRTGNRSKLVAGILEREGYKNIYNYKDGIVNWISEKRKVSKP